MKSEKTMFDLVKIPFSRKGSYLSVLNKQEGRDIDRGSVDELYLSRSWNNSCALKRTDLIKLSLLHDGEEVPYEYTATPSLLRLDSEYGYVEICISPCDTFRLRGKGVKLRCYAAMGGHEGSLTREDGTWEISFTMIGKFLFVPITGNMEASGGLKWMYQTPEPATIDFSADSPDGIFEGAINTYLSNGQKKNYYEPFDDAVSGAQADYEKWDKKYPSVSEEFEKTRALATYVIWSSVMSPYKLITNEVVYMSRNSLADAFGWQQGYQAIAVYRDVKQAWDFLCNMFAYQLEDGQLPDWINDECSNYLSCKPPFQGLAFAWLWENADMNQLTVEDFAKLYYPMEKWAGWWFNYRDTDNDDIPQYSQPDESGWDDGSIFAKGVPVESPDLCAFLVLVTEALWKMAEKIGRNADARYWKGRSEKLLNDMIKELWDGEKFVARLSGTHEIVGGACVALYQPIILGKRLPENILNKLIADLSEENGYLCEHGIASEHLKSPLLELLNGFCRGVVVSPVQLMMALGAKSAGADALAQEIALRFCKKVARDGFSLCHFPYDSDELVIRPSEKAQHFVADMSLDTSWTAAIFLVLAGEILK